MKFIAKKRPNSVLGLNLSAGQLRAFQVERAKGTVEVVKSASAALSLDLMQAEVEQIAREIKNCLDTAGIGEKHCVVALPANWIMSQQTKVPALSPEDTASFLQLEAEKGFPCDTAQLQIARSFCRSGEVMYATQLAVRKDQIERLTAILKLAGLKPVSFSLGLAALPEVASSPSEGRIAVSVEAGGVTMLVSANGGIASLRTCEAIVDSNTGGNGLNNNGVARELRITFEQVPTELRANLRQLNLCGPAETVRQLAETLSSWARSVGLTITCNSETDQPIGNRMTERIAARWLENETQSLEFLPPIPSRWSVLIARYNSKRLASVGYSIAAAAVLTIGAFGWQEFRLWSLGSEWGTMQAQVTELEGTQSLIREYRPWYDTSFRNLSILRRVTESFPENGSVTAKSFEVHGPANVSITGTARDNASLLKTIDQLRKTREIQGLKVEQIRGKAPLQFTLSFRWNNNSGS